MTGGFNLLEGRTVVEFGDHLACAVCGYHLALLGARVLLLEPPEGCRLRRYPGGRQPSPLFLAFGRGKRSVDMDSALRQPELLGEIDVVIEPTPRNRARYGQELAKSFDQARDKGPISVDFREADGTLLSETAAQAAFGMSAFLGAESQPPLRVGYEAVTYSAGVLAVQSVLAAMFVRRRHSARQRIQVPLSRVAANILNNVLTASVEPDQDTSFSRGWASAPAKGVPTEDGEIDFLFYGPKAEEDWVRFCEQIGLPELGSDPRFNTSFARTHRAGELAGRLSKATRGYSREALLQLLWNCGAMAVPRCRPDEAALSQQAKDNGMVESADPAGPIRVASPWELDGRRAAMFAVPEIHADNDTVLAAGRN